MYEIWGTQQTVKELKTHDESARVFLPNGKPPQLGELFRNPDMGHAFRLIAEKGPDTYYKGIVNLGSQLRDSST